ncbi:MAG: STAS domain-containing protein [Actinobacteria bacterium]|nr:STAS domain-containing protein [Actinomycetota bacterium]
MISSPAVMFERESQATVAVPGDVDGPAVTELDAAFEGARRQHPAIIRVDLRAAESISRAALSLFLRWQELAQRTGFHVLFVHARERIADTLRAAGLDSLYGSEET